MADREKVINGLTHCTAWSGLHECQPKVGDDCPYEDEADCQLSLMRNALVLLKEQEPVEPRYEDCFANWSARCGYCNAYIVGCYKYCPGCGRKVKWE